MKCKNCNTDNAHNVQGYLDNGKYKERCNECSGYKSAQREWVPEYVKEDRKKNFKGQLQPFRGGELSKEYIEAYPEQTKKMVNSGTISQKEVSKAKYTWKDLPNWHNRNKTK